jgi:hypothetical protein
MNRLVVTSNNRSPCSSPTSIAYWASPLPKDQFSFLTSIRLTKTSSRPVSTAARDRSPPTIGFSAESNILETTPIDPLNVCFTLRTCQIVGPAQQSDGRFDLVRSLNIEADPSGIRQDVVRFSHTCGDELVADVLRKRNIHQIIAMHMTNLSPGQTIFRAAKTMGSGRHAKPAHSSIVNLRTGFHSHARN